MVRARPERNVGGCYGSSPIFRANWCTGASCCEPVQDTLYILQLDKACHLEPFRRSCYARCSLTEGDHCLLARPAKHLQPGRLKNSASGANSPSSLRLTTTRIMYPAKGVRTVGMIWSNLIYKGLSLNPTVMSISSSDQSNRLLFPHLH